MNEKLRRLATTAKIRLFGLVRIPLVFMVSPRVLRIDDTRCELMVPLNYVTKNHWGSMYFGALAIGADCAAGLFALYKADRIAKNGFSLVFKNFKAEFVRRPEEDVIFVCDDAPLIDDLLIQCQKSAGRETRDISITAYAKGDRKTPVAHFSLGLSMKPKRS